MYGWADLLVLSTGLVFAFVEEVFYIPKIVSTLVPDLLFLM